MRIFKYQQWLDESEEVAPAPAAPAPAAPSTDTLPEAPLDDPAANAPAPGDMPADAPADMPPMPDAGADVPAEGGEYEQLDVARKDAIRAFKAKYEEFKNAPEDQKESMKEELKTLFDAMNAAVEAFDQMVAKEIGAEEAAPEIEDEP